jgi:two-component system LytT family response regulator
MKIKVLIADDEPLARKRIRDLLEKSPLTEVIGEAGNGRETLQSILKNKPDLVFLDIRMPEMNGFDTLEELGPGEMPHVIFVTAYDKYALRAFEIHALDYLLKPFDRDRFERALQRAVSFIRQSRSRTELQTGLSEFMRNFPKQEAYAERFMVRIKDKLVPIKSKDIDWIEAAGKYVILHSGQAQHMIRDSMKNMESRLNPAHFLRTHRSYMVNLDRILEVEPWFHGEYRIFLKGGKELPLSRTFREKFKETFNLRH